jgi:hypothetical protein
LEHATLSHVRFREKGGKKMEIPVHHKLEEFLDQYLGRTQDQETESQENDSERRRALRGRANAT